jgi:hypothetical protein
MHEPFDPTPIRELSADENPTPLGLTAVGFALLLALAGAWLVGSSDTKEASGSSSGAALSGAALSGAAASTASPGVEGRR